MKTEQQFIAIIKPREAIKEWFEKLAIYFNESPLNIDRFGLEPLRTDASVYVLPDGINRQETAAQFVKENYQFIFEKELLRIVDDSKLWPQTLDFETFSKWFQVEIHSRIIVL